ncbi:unnamed protein product, partial [Rotaria magnacalcarata]
NNNNNNNNNNNKNGNINPQPEVSNCITTNLSSLQIDKYLSKLTIDELSTRTQLKPTQIRVWFNNKRTRERHE